jgi:uncharacterized repeat protein (TIGR03803 family)
MKVKILGVSLLISVFAASAHGQKYHVVHSFGAYPDGDVPFAGLTQDPTTLALYGTASVGGVHGYGTLFSITGLTYKTIHSFGSGLDDGLEPEAAVVDINGAIYGTTFSSRGQHCGTVWKIVGTFESILHSFTCRSDGGVPTALAADAAGNLYGVATEYGNGTNCIGNSGCGTVFKIDTSGAFSVFHSFTGVDGWDPHFITVDSVGNIWVSTWGGEGAVVEFTPQGSQMFAYDFTGKADGGSGPSTVTFDSAGNVYGTTQAGGAFGKGTVFKIDSNGVESVLYSFGPAPDGNTPIGGVVLDSTGTIYGTTFGGGAHGVGTLFELEGGVETILHQFTYTTDGAYPWGNLLLAKNGILYGTTLYGGNIALTCQLDHGCGVIFAVTF